MKLRLNSILRRAILAAMSAFSFSGASLLAADPIEGFNSPLLGYWGNSFGGAAWGLHLTLNDSFAARGYSGVTYGGAVFSFGGSGDIIGGYGRYEMVDGKEKYVTYGISLGGSLTLTGSHYTFVNNSAKKQGGAIHAGDILFSDCSSVLFDSNSTPLEGTNSTGGAGGAIYSSGYVLFDDCNHITFKNNSARYGAVAVADTLHFDHCGSITVENNISQFAVINGALKIESCSGDVVFRNNVTTSSGGAVVSGGFVCLNNTGSLLFEKNSSAYMGGVVSSSGKNTFLLNSNEEIIFRNNSSALWGGVFNVSSPIEIINNGRIVFWGNEAYVLGGAIEIGGNHNVLTISRNKVVEFIENKVTKARVGSSWGGQAGAFNSNGCLFDSNETVLFRNNYAGSLGGAVVVGDYGSLVCASFLNNNKVSFVGNKAGERGGAIYGDSAEFSYNENVLFDGNEAAQGGAVYLDSSKALLVEHNDSIVFSGNQASKGGAIFVPDLANLSVEFRENELVAFSENQASTGAAIYAYANNIVIENNTKVSFCCNVSTEGASAVYAHLGSLTIENNAWVEFLDNQQGIGAYAVHAQDLTISGNDYVVFFGNERGLQGRKAVIDTKAGSSSSSIHFYDAFNIFNHGTGVGAVEFNPTGDGTILLSSPTAQCEVKYAANLGGGTMEWENYAHLTVGSNYTVGSQNKGASLVFNQSGRRYNLKSLTVNGNLILQNGSDITFKLDQATEMSAPQGFVFVDDFLILDKTVSITVEAPPKVVQDNTLWSLVSVGTGIEYDGVTYVYREKVGWEYSDELGTHTRDSINDLFSWTFSDEKHSLLWIDNTLFYYSGNKERSLYKVARLYSDRTWRGDVFDYYDINKKKVTESKEASTSYGDSLLCWMVAGCNIIEYWQDKYAPLYQADFLVSNTDSSSHSSPIFAYYKKISGVVDKSSSFETVMYPWFLNKKSQNDKIAISKHDYSPWVNSFGFSEENFITLRVKNIDSMSDFFSNLKLVFDLSDSAIFLLYGEYKDNERIRGHVFTLWGAEIFPEKDICFIHVTDSDSEQDSMLRFTVKYDEKNKVACISGKKDSDMRIERLCYMTTPEGMDEMLEDYYSGKNDLEWTGRGKTWSAKIDSEVRLANVDDGFKIACSGAGKTVYAHKYFTNGERANFVFGEKVGEVAVANKRVVVERDMGIGTAKVTGKGYVFEGNGTVPTLNALNLTVGSGADLKMQQMSLSTNVLDVRGTLDVWDGNASTKVDAVIVDMGWQGKLICGGMSLEQTDEATAETVQIGLTHYCVAHGLSELNVGKLTGNGTLGCYIDFGGAISLVPDFLLSQSDSLNKAFYDMLNLSGDVDDYKYSYIGTNLTYKLDATQEYETGICLNNSAVVFALEAGEESVARTIGSHGNAAANAEADISISETMGGTVEAPDTALSTVSGADVRLGSNTSITAASLTISEGSTLYSDGEINLTQNSGAIQVSNGAELGGSGTFGATVVNSGGVLRAGGMQGGARYNGLTLEAGATLVLSAEAMSTPLARSASGVSLTLTGDLKVAEGAVVQVACGLDFLNNCNAGEVLTFNAVKLSGTADSELTDLLNGVTEFVFRDEDDSLAALSTVGAYVHHVDWQSGADDTLQLSFVLTAASEDSLVWTNAGGDGVWSTSALNWQNPEGETVAFTADANVLICDGGTVTLEGCLTPGNVVISTPEAVTLGGGGALSGSGSLTKEGSGELYLSTNNEDFAGVINLCGGNTYVECEGALGSAQVNLDNAALHLGGGVTSAGVIVSGQSTLSGADALTHLGVNEAAELTVEGGFTVGEDVLFATDGAATYIGDLTLSGGVISIGGLLTLEGNLTFTEGCTTTLDLLNSEVARYGSYELMLVNGAVEGYHDGALVLQNAEGSTILYDAESGKLVLNFNPDLTWQGGKKAVWQVGAAGWTDDGVYEDGKTILFNGKGTVTIVGEVAPGNMTVDITKSLTIKQNKKQPGGISGMAVLTKYGNGTLTLSGDNSGWNGTVYLHEGGITAGTATAFGESRVVVRGGVLNLNKKNVANTIEQDGDVKITKGSKFSGDYMQMSGTLLKGSALRIDAGHTATLYSGTVNGKLSGNGSVRVEGSVLLDGGSISTAGLVLDKFSDLQVSKHLKMNSKTSAVELLHGSELYVGGKTSAYSMLLEGADLTQGASLTLKGLLSAENVAGDSSTITLSGSLSASALKLVGSELLQSGRKNKISLKTGADLFASELTTEGAFSAKGDLLMSSSGLNVDNDKSAGKISLTGKSAVHELTRSHIKLNGKMSVSGSLAMEHSSLTLVNAEGYSKTLSLAVKNTLTLSDCELVIAGKMSAGNMSLSGSSVELYDASGKNKAMGLTVKGNLTLGADSDLILSGKVSTGNLTLEGGSITFSSSKLQTITVKKELSLLGDIELTLPDGLQIKQGKTYKLITFKTLTGYDEETDSLYSALGLNEKYCTLALQKKAITLTVTEEQWNAYVEDRASGMLSEVPEEGGESTEEESAVASSVSEPDSETEETAEELLTAPQPVAAAAVDPLLRKAADTLVQSTWGTVNASRAFGDTIAARGAHATLLAEGWGAAWLSTMGGSSRISTDGDRNGADFTLSGAAFGVEGRVTEKSTLGVAIGNSWGKVSTFSAFPVDQDSMHIGIYGNHTLTESLTLSWMATH
ncbi:MAG: hypothetical protein IJA63_08885, partial [Akkermansia sp.]|nr:hypothetical protein [Akkermansia sp.]